MDDLGKNKKLITNLQKKIAKLRENNSQLMFIIQNMPGNVYWKNKDGIYMGCNNNLARIIKLKNCNRIIGTSTHRFLNKKIADEVVKKDEELMKMDKDLLFEEKGLNESGDAVIYLTKKVPMRDKHGKVIGLLGVSLDINDRKRIERLLIREREAAQKYSKTMEVISGCIAREMKIPLAIINLNNDLLGIDLNKKDFDLNSSEERHKIADYHDNVKFAVRSADNVIGMLLMKLQHVTKTQLGPGNFEFQSMKSLVNNALKEYPFLKRERNLIRWDPNTSPDFKYFGNKDLTKNVLFNLLKNALRAIKEFDKGEIFITLKSNDKHHYLLFKDTGMGIAKEHLNGLFQQFDTHAEGGTGLGLAFCKMVMNSYGGDITCKSKQGEYTEFNLSFPKEGGKATTLREKLEARRT